MYSESNITNSENIVYKLPTSNKLLELLELEELEELEEYNKINYINKKKKRNCFCGCSLISKIKFN